MDHPGAPEKAAAPAILPPSNVKAADIPGDQGHSLRITWTASLSESGGGVSWYRIFRSRSNVLTTPIPLTRFASFDSLNAWDAHFTILVDSVAAGVTQYVDSAVYFNSSVYYYWLQATGSVGSSRIVAQDIASSVSDAPGVFAVSPAHPNPFNPSTAITYRLPVISPVVVSIFTSTGQKILESREGTVHAGSHTYVWNASGMPSGLYFFTVRAGAYAGSGKMLLLK
jgi:hypothetical protein